jgi:prepilin-type N-terminal cleavage/methylation domain-containing protein
MLCPRRTDRLHGAARGFTLVEVIVVVLILAIAGAVVIPMVGDTEKFQSLAAARMVVSDLQYARDTAITTQQDVTVAFDPDTESYTVSNASGPLIHPMTKEAYTVDFRSSDGFGSLNVIAASFNGSESVTFDVTGAASSDGTVEIMAGRHTYHVKVYRSTGRVKALYLSAE